VSINEALFERAQKVIPGGVNSPVRAFRAVGGTPRFIARAEGAWMVDADGRRYVDYIGSWGPMILGHGHPAVLDAVLRAARDGFSFGAPTEREVELAEEIIRHVPGVEQVRLVSSGTEACMSAIRLARAATGRSRLIKFEGCYHGHADALLVKAGSGLATFGHPTSAGVPPEVVQHTSVLSYNDVEQLEQAFAAHGDQLACVIIEPIAGNMNFVRPSHEFIAELRERCTAHGAVLIFDEVMTGFRVDAKGAQGLFGVVPDLTTLGKVIGGGMPVGAFGGRRDIMQKVAPVGPVYQAGTLSGNPLAMAAGIATLQALTPELHDDIARRTRALVEGLRGIAARQGVPFTADSAGSMFGFFFRAEPVRSFSDALTADVELFRRFFHAALARGVYLAPSAFEAGFLSAAHGDAEIASTLERLDAALAEARH
jgi:glutamate-1-semialdehyde 2,1-aminomutase